ncbi:alpha/beta hydrolase family protein [Tenacibaculum sp. IB213877]|uniref:alpha/beta hydrolase family protein n=1 Tax=Tenacibaculum sp. IB213877 TaxID=3097351 RepID=UPI002A598B65|nr:prolyl oligopeptidase family serine peptidase [Tenacibaculum sp. IB213877]MDY0779471.1 prolyl oligopeptidase family serine peptidase [Tenacibaculum sp. IB213877]
MKIRLLLIIILTSVTLFAQNGKLVSKKAIQVSKIPAIWNKISENNTLKKDFEHLNNVNFYEITYKSDDKLVNGIVAEPNREGKFPLIIFNRGGNKEIGRKAKVKTLFIALMATSKLVDEGYVVIASCYREDDEFGGKDVNDVLSLTETAKEINKADSDRIGMFGWSRGGMMTYLSLKESNKIKTAVVGNGPTNLFELIKERPKMETMVCAKLIPNYQENKDEELKKRSVMYWYDQLHKNSSLLILSGTKDKRVNTNQADWIAEKLATINYNFELKKFDTNHSFSNKQKELQKLLSNWFRANL